MGNIFLIFICIIAGISSGIASGIGIWPIYKQPKNFRWQMAFLAMSVFALFIVIIALLENDSI